jgi:phage/plasmid-like protein (TIGR03299 family)
MIMSHEVETMAYANAVPWHGLGNRVDGNLTPDEMLVAAGLDWTVEQHPCFARIGDQNVDIRQSALVRSTDKQILTITSPGWKPLQNRDALEFFREYTESGGATLETAGSLRNGRVVWALASVNKSFMLNGRDEVKGYILLTSPHEVGKAISVRATSVRVVCANTLAMAEQGTEHYRQSHFREFDVAAAKRMVAFTQDGIKTMELEAQALQSLKLSKYDTVRLLAKFFQPVETEVPERAKDLPTAQPQLIENERRVKALIDDPALLNQDMEQVLWAVRKAPGATPGNGWGVLNGVTYWSDHMAGRDRSARLYSSWMGVNNNRKQDVKKELLEMAA